MTHRLLLPFVLLLGCPPILGDDDDASTDDDDVTANDDDVSTDDDDVMDDDDFADDDDVADCGPWEWPLELFAFGSDGVPTDVFGAGEEITLIGRVTNTCPEAFAVQTNSGCLLDPWVLEAASGVAEGRGCDDAITFWDFAPGQMQQDSVPMGMLQADTWIWRAGFVEGQSQVLTFEVLAPPG